MDELKEMREGLDLLDQQIISLLIQRMEIIKKIGDWKRENHYKIQDKSREQEIISHVEHTVHHPIYKEMISFIYTKMMEESRLVQKFHQEAVCPFKNIGVLGCGLMGGSICKGLKAKDPSIHIATVSNQAEDALMALKEGWVDQDYATLDLLVQNSDLIVLAVPISAILSMAKNIKEVFQGNHSLVVVDIASVKEEIVSVFETLTQGKIEFVGTHPMSGKETKGFANSQVTLFSGYPWIIVPHQKNSPEVVAAVEQWIRFLGGELGRLTPEEHDKKMALISHLPGLISKALMEFTLKKDPNAINVAGPGFKSMTRLAHSNPVMRQEILSSNRRNLKELGEEWVSYLRSLLFRD